MSNVIEVLTPFFPLLLALAVLFSFLAFKRYKGLTHAKYLVEHQYDKADPTILKQGFTHFKGDQLERFRIAYDRVIAAVGEDGLLVGHIQWSVLVTENNDLDINNFEIPSFKR